MIRVLIAEDEPPILRALCSLITRTDPAFQIVFAARDGEHAAQWLAEHPVDVVFTDIRMPVMDGFALMERIRSSQPNALAVVISGYQDFEYTSHAVRMQAFDYLLKPVTQDALTVLLSRLKEAHIQKRREAMQALVSARIQRAAATDIQGLAPEMPQSLGVLLLCAGGMPYCQDTELCAGAQFFDGFPMEAFVADTLRRFTRFSWVFLGDSPVERCVIFEVSEGDDPAELSEYLHECLLPHAGIPLSCACLPSPVSLLEVYPGLVRLRQTLFTQVRIGRSAFFRMEENTDEKDREPPGGADLPKLFAQWEREDYTQKEIHTALAALCERLPDGETQHELRQAIDEAVSTALTIASLKENIGALFSGALFAHKGERARFAGEIAAYLRENYEKRITTQTLSDLFGYVPCYLSAIFRREMGMSPSEYLVRLRLSEAKRMLRETPEIKVRTVAAQVGFKDQYHFSKTFRKYEGMWPSSYRRISCGVE